MNTTTKYKIAAIAMILVDIFNLGEQFGIYFIAKENSIEEEAQQRFFFILFGIGGATLLRPMFLWSKLQIVFSIWIEVGEFVAYLALLPRTTNLDLVASLFFVLEIILHVIILVTKKCNRTEIKWINCIHSWGCCPVRILMYSLIYLSPILFLFLDPSSKFRDTYYENLLILNVFFGATYIEFSLAVTLCGNEPEPSLDDFIYEVWQYITLVFYNILAVIIFITTLVFAGQAIDGHRKGDNILKDYDLGVYIYCLVNYSILFCDQMRSLRNKCSSILSSKK